MEQGAPEVWSEWDAGWYTRNGVASATGLPSVAHALATALGRALDQDEERLARELAALYRSEINVRVSWTATGLWKGEVGDEHGFDKTTPSLLPLRVLLDWLPAAACRAFPRSDYARSYGVGAPRSP